MPRGAARQNGFCYDNGMRRTDNRYRPSRAAAVRQASAQARPQSARHAGSPARAQRGKPGAAMAAAAVAAVIALMLGAALALSQCGGGTGTAAAQKYVSPYDWSGLDRTDGRYAYYEDGALQSRLGVDVSDHQGEIAWQAVAADGIDFAYVRLGNRGYTEGMLYADEYAAANLDGAAAAGLDVGAYFFSQATSVAEAREEADFVLGILAGRALALPVAFDHEPVSDAAGRANNVDGETLTACALAFCERLEAAGYTTMVYGNAGDMARYNRAVLGNRPVWFAEYGAPTPTAQFDFSIWQYSNAGTVAGIATSVDMNLLMETAPQPV